MDHHLLSWPIEKQKTANIVFKLKIGELETSRAQKELLRDLLSSKRYLFILYWENEVESIRQIIDQAKNCKNPWTENCGSETKLTAWSIQKHICKNSQVHALNILTGYLKQKTQKANKEVYQVD